MLVTTRQSTLIRTIDKVESTQFSPPKKQVMQKSTNVALCISPLQKCLARVVHLYSNGSNAIMTPPCSRALVISLSRGRGRLRPISQLFLGSSVSFCEFPLVSLLASSSASSSDHLNFITIMDFSNDRASNTTKVSK